MSVAIDSCVVHFPECYDERGEWEAESKGWLQGVVVELPDGRHFPVFVYDPVRLAQDLEANAANGDPVVAEPYMIVVPEVKRSAIEAAMKRLFLSGYFNRCNPLAMAE